MIYFFLKGVHAMESIYRKNVTCLYFFRKKKSNMTTNNEMTLLNWLLGPGVYQCISLPNPWKGFHGEFFA